LNNNDILGDHYILNVDDFHWSQIFIGGEQPEPRFLHTSCDYLNKLNENGINYDKKAFLYWVV